MPCKDCQPPTPSVYAETWPQSANMPADLLASKAGQAGAGHTCGPTVWGGPWSTSPPPSRPPPR
eukprot:365386-Chlamydomonas_euryale.AAC.3